MNYIVEIRDRGLEEYLLEKDYTEFIGLLKYFVEVQEEKADIIKIFMESDGNFKICDENDKPLENNYTIDVMSFGPERKYEL